MSWLRNKLSKLTQKSESRRESSSEQNQKTMPTVKFDPATVSKQVKANLRKNIESLDEVGKKDFKQVYDAALRCVLAGGDLQVLTVALRKIEGMPVGRAAEIARSLNRKAKAEIERERRASLGITHAIWMYANAPCMIDPRHPTVAEAQQDSAHSAANGKKFDINKGLFLNGKWTWPGFEKGCKCSSKSVIPALEGL